MFSTPIIVPRSGETRCLQPMPTNNACNPCQNATLTRNQCEGNTPKLAQRNAGTMEIGTHTPTFCTDSQPIYSIAPDLRHCPKVPHFHQVSTVVCPVACPDKEQQNVGEATHVYARLIVHLHSVGGGLTRVSLDARGGMKRVAIASASSN